MVASAVYPSRLLTGHRLSLTGYGTSRARFELLKMYHNLRVSYSTSLDGIFRLARIRLKLCLHDRPWTNLVGTAPDQENRIKLYHYEVHLENKSLSLRGGCTPKKLG